MKTIMGLFKHPRDARRALADLARLAPSARQLPAKGAVDALMKMGLSKSDAALYADNIKGGETLDIAAVEDDKEAEALAIMRRYAGNDAARSIARKAEAMIPIIEEELSVGKREFDAGGVRVATHVTSRPVEEAVALREEHISVERRKVNRPIDPQDKNAFREREVEVKVSAEEPVISKSAHVVEEVRLHKDSTEREERIRETLRQTEIEMSKLPGEKSKMTGEKKSVKH